MLKIFNPFYAAFYALALSSLAVAAEPTLKLGDAAPPLAVSQFVKGEPVKELEKGKIYVVEFWATWCPPCRESIPHLTQMQKTYPDVIFIGSDVGEKEATVVPFVKKMGDKMNYRVAIDEANTNGANFMDASGQKYIPRAFLIDKDLKIVWIGFPMELEPVLKQEVAGTFDAKKWAMESAALDKVQALMDSKDNDGAFKLAEQDLKSNPDWSDKLGTMEFDILLSGKGGGAAAKKAEDLTPHITDPETLNYFAWQLATDDKATPETLATAKTLAEASLGMKTDDPSYLDTLARVYAVKKDFKTAVELEKKALDKVGDNDQLRKSISGELKAYQAEKIPKEEE